MNNKEIIDEIRSHLTKEKDIDIAYLQTELEIYKKMNNEEVIYAIANMLFQYLDPKIKEQLDLKTHAIQIGLHAFFVIYAFISSFAVCFIVSMTLSASSRVLPTAER